MLCFFFVTYSRTPIAEAATPKDEGEASKLDVSSHSLAMRSGQSTQGRAASGTSHKDSKKSARSQTLKVPYTTLCKTVRTSL